MTENLTGPGEVYLFWIGLTLIGLIALGSVLWHVARLVRNDASPVEGLAPVGLLVLLLIGIGFVAQGNPTHSMPGTGRIMEQQEARPDFARAAEKEAAAVKPQLKADLVQERDYLEADRRSKEAEAEANGDRERADSLKNFRKEFVLDAE